MMASEPRLSRASVGRLSLYLRCIEDLRRQGQLKVSSKELGLALGVSDAQVRRDIGALGHLGHPGVGYPAHELTEAIRRALGIDRCWDCLLVGVGNLGRALLRYRGFSQQGFRIVALIDTDPGKIGQAIGALTVQAPDRLAAIVAETRAELGLLAVPAESAQLVADLLASSGVRGLLNFAPTVLRVPAGMSLVSVDLTVQLEQLAFQVQLASPEEEAIDTR